MNEEAKTGDARQGCFCTGAGPQVTQMFRNMWSGRTNDHFRNSRIEFLKGLRSLIDDRIERISRQESKGTHVTVE